MSGTVSMNTNSQIDLSVIMCNYLTPSMYHRVCNIILGLIIDERVYRMIARRAGLQDDRAQQARKYSQKRCSSLMSVVARTISHSISVSWIVCTSHSANRCYKTRRETL